jgi:site-specific DNA recombinase
VQDVLDARNASKLRRGKRDFAFSGLINCGHCGCAMVGELKKGRHIYYHRTGYKGKCGEPYVREEVIAEKFTHVLGRLSFGEELLQWVSAALRESHADQRRSMMPPLPVCKPRSSDSSTAFTPCTSTSSMAA